ncbi:hypothetical protein DFR56_11865 [Pseudogracilibacillus auburnensis]|uniref:Uncharacterized protein n=1 Tax=Pseudogracilibacillus auburnensis TaxID=1494959 RepID=A0A2V3W145_9BACI|nr:hypothetical protein DFR56_11865 [Pseudogracilibacillus auburnensis]
MCLTLAGLLFTMADVTELKIESKILKQEMKKLTNKNQN